jgi:hypothetical protein
MKISKKYGLNPVAETFIGYTGTRALSERLNRFQMEEEEFIKGYYDSFDATMDITQWGVNNFEMALGSGLALKNLPSLVRSNANVKIPCEVPNSAQANASLAGVVKLDPRNPNIRISQMEVKKSIVESKMGMKVESLEPTLVKRTNGELLMVDGHHSYAAALAKNIPEISFKILTEDEFMAFYGLAKEGMSFDDFLELFNLQSKVGPCIMVEEFTPR